jgi:hypothetical protein
MDDRSENDRNKEKAEGGRDETRDDTGSPEETVEKAAGRAGARGGGARRAT